jgi:dephospho-CoA kinase
MIMTEIIGLTGGIASGKSTVATMIKELGLPVIDADQAARAVVEKGEDAYLKIVAAFGKSILHEDGTINREKLGVVIFNNKNERKKLNDIVHPAVRKHMNKEKHEYIELGESTVVMDIPLLFESNLTDMFDKILLVYVDEEIQVNRLMKRNDLNEIDAKARISSQMPLFDKKKLADAVVNNNGTIEETKKQLHDILLNWDVI